MQGLFLPAPGPSSTEGGLLGAGQRGSENWRKELFRGRCAGVERVAIIEASRRRGFAKRVKAMNKSRFAAVTAVVFIPAIALTYGNANDDDGKAFIFEPVRLGAISNSIEATGTVEAVAMVDVGSEVSGLIDKVFVSFNDAVKAGQPVAQLDRAAFEARVGEAGAAQEVATALVQVQQSALKRAEVGVVNAGTARKLAQAQAAAAQARGDQAELELQRKLQLSRSGVATDREVSQLRTLRDTGEAELRAARGTGGDASQRDRDRRGRRANGGGESSRTPKPWSRRSRRSSTRPRSN